MGQRKTYRGGGKSTGEWGNLWENEKSIGGTGNPLGFAIVSNFVLIYRFFCRRQLKNKPPPPAPIIKQEDILLKKSIGTKKENLNSINGAIGKESDAPVSDKANHYRLLL